MVCTRAVTPIVPMTSDQKRSASAVNTLAEHRKNPGPSGGFTLIELLVAISVMSLLAVLSWRGLDGMARAQAQTSLRADQVLTLQAGLAQWKIDLDTLALAPQGDVDEKLCLGLVAYRADVPSFLPGDPTLIRQTQSRRAVGACRPTSRDNRHWIAYQSARYR